MSNADKTREALMNTMVKTKTGAQANEVPAVTAASKAATPAKPVAKKKAVSKKKVVAKKAPARKAAASKPAVKSGPAADPFQSKGRIWPD